MGAEHGIAERTELSKRGGGVDVQWRKGKHPPAENQRRIWAKYGWSPKTPERVPMGEKKAGKKHNLKVEKTRESENENTKQQKNSRMGYTGSD